MSDHEWCRDVRRDEAVRAAEDAAAVPSIQHRNLPEQVALLWASLGDIIGRVVRLEAEMDAGQDEEADAASDEAVAHGATLSALAEARQSLAAANRGIAWLTAERDAARARVAELEAAPPPRGWLTAEERETLKNAADAAESWWGSPSPSAKVIKSLLARSTPPRVKVPHLDDLEADERPVWESACHEWIAAIRAAGGEVADE